MRPRLRLLLCALAIGAGAPAGAEPGAWLADGRAQVARARQLTAGLGAAAPHAKNAILFVADGMGLTTVAAARILEGQLRGEPGEENWLSFERLPWVALTKTYNTDQQVPDSAGTMTALVTGAKTRAGIVSLDETVPLGDAAAAAGRRLTTILEQAEQRGLSTGVVTTSRLTHATPAACYAHVPDRDWEDDSTLPADARALDFPDIARQLIEFPHGDGLEVALGGGRRQFLPVESADPEDPAVRGARRDRRDLSAEWLTRFPKSRYVWNREQFEAVDSRETDHLLGLFEPSHMQFEADRAGDRAGEPSLAEMTARALEVLSRNPRGYFLMVEGGRVDHAHHMTNAYRALTDTIEFSDAVRTALARTDRRDTLVVVTSDHDHMLTMGGYPRRGNPILGKVRTNANGEPGGELALDAMGRPYTTLGYFNGPGYTGASSTQPEGPKRFPHLLAVAKPSAKGRPDLTAVDTTDRDYLQETTVPLAGETHSGGDVPVYADGPGAQLFHGVQEQSYVYHAMVEALGWNAASAP